MPQNYNKFTLFNFDVHVFQRNHPMLLRAVVCFHNFCIFVGQTFSLHHFHNFTCFSGVSSPRIVYCANDHSYQYDTEFSLKSQ